MPLHRGRQVLLARGSRRRRRGGRLRQFVVDDRGGDGFLRIKRGQPADEILQFAHIAGPAVALEPLDGGRLDLLGRQALPRREREEMADQVGDVLDRARAAAAAASAPR